LTERHFPPSLDRLLPFPITFGFLSGYAVLPSDSGAFERRLAEVAALVEGELAGILGDNAADGEVYRPPRLAAAMRHAVLSGGKRFRPFLVVESARLFGVTPAASVTAAAAVECLHCYSLVHDDLPAMDDDDLRRGVPTVHKAFDEATAVLAGDALLTLAFDLLAGAGTHPQPEIRIALVQALARAGGVGGMAGGQMLDVEAEGAVLDEASVRRIQAMKTGALIAACCEMGAILGDAPTSARQRLGAYGRSLGLAFQIADDLLDVEASAEAIGKASGKDDARGKATFVALLGVEGARDLLSTTIVECESHLAGLAGDTSTLAAAARFAAERKR
jgi:farnesyl diphosphate synthase